MNILDDLFISPFTLSASSDLATIIPFSIANCKSGDTAVETPKIHILFLSLPNLGVLHAFFLEKSFTYHFGTSFNTLDFSVLIL